MYPRPPRTRAYEQYRLALLSVQSEARALKFGDVVEILEAWLAQLAVPMNDEQLTYHAKKVMRGLGGMGGLGDIAMTGVTRAYFASIERLHSAAKAVVDSCAL